ncbi:uncharacterized protein LOC118011673 [Mirounga leonina]|uniref:uncharacterized protein LOC118011673 n=1 Tax=Mirounga leonina TaxID=9715 RepID=UPI00156BF6D1|nr:uncharacterized protein LOC118011673 [Mirounga leonina]
MPPAPAPEGNSDQMRAGNEEPVAETESRRSKQLQTGVRTELTVRKRKTAYRQTGLGSATGTLSEYGQYRVLWHQEDRRIWRGYAGGNHPYQSRRRLQLSQTLTLSAVKMAAATASGVASKPAVTRLKKLLLKASMRRIVELMMRMRTIGP